MKWFYNLKRAIRIVIAVAAWLPLVVFAGVISGSIGENGENMQVTASRRRLAVTCPRCGVYGVCRDCPQA